MPPPREPYPYSELDVFRAGYDRGREFVRESVPVGSGQGNLEGRLVEELASRRLTLYDLTAEGLLMLGLEASFVPRSIFDAGVRRALEEAT
jgi:hypothetical protein